MSLPLPISAVSRVWKPSWPSGMSGPESLSQADSGVRGVRPGSEGDCELYRLLSVASEVEEDRAGDERSRVAAFAILTGILLAELFIE